MAPCCDIDARAPQSRSLHLEIQLLQHTRVRRADTALGEPPGESPRLRMWASRSPPPRVTVHLLSHGSCRSALLPPPNRCCCSQGVSSVSPPLIVNHCAHKSTGALLCVCLPCVTPYACSSCQGHRPSQPAAFATARWGVARALAPCPGARVCAAAPPPSSLVTSAVGDDQHGGSTRLSTRPGAAPGLGLHTPSGLCLPRAGPIYPEQPRLSTRPRRQRRPPRGPT